MYNKLDSNKLAELETEILKQWDKDNVFERSVEERPADNPFVFFEGPPTANGKPGIHHVISRAVKDTVCRLKTMQGYRVERKAGWDTHGLPVEIEVEKNLGLDGKDQVEAYGVETFNKACHESVWTYKQEWDELTRRMGYWVDLDDPYITYTNDYIETVWWILKEFWKKGLIYQGFKILPYCPHCETPLSGHEVSQGYETVKDPSIFVKAKLKSEPDTFFLVWTTTPWTLISNVALALNPDVTYVKVEHKGQKLILAEERLLALDGNYKILKEYKGSELTDIDYEPFFDFIEPEKRAHYTLLADFVSTSDGSGIVHIAPAFGEDDYQVGKKYDLPVVNPVNKSGQFMEMVTPWAGKFVKDADVDILVDLKHRGLLYKSEKIEHSYPHCWRCKSPLLYYARKSWYIETTAIKEKLIRNNNKINWYPAEVGSGRFGEWLDNVIDWSLSRDRFWGTPLPVWRCESCEHSDCIGGIEELREKGRDVPDDLDLHKPYVDQIDLTCPECGGSMKRVPEVIDCWFDSGSMPYAQWHYPFENVEKFQSQFPADFISEGVDQTRGWFYSLLVIGAFLFDEPTYKTCVSLGHILDKDGQKMSKSKGNVVNPFVAMDKYGADTLRWYLLTVSPPWLPTRFDPEGMNEVNRKFFGTLVNTYNFFIMYAEIDKFQYNKNERIPVGDRSEIDRWICSSLHTLTQKVTELLQVYDLTKAGRAISEFVIDDLSNWYVRRSRRRFWKSEMGKDKQGAFQTLYECLITISRIMAPIAPFISEAVYKNLTAKQDDMSDSVHLCEYPRSGSGFVDYHDDTLEERMNLVRRIVEAGRSVRNDTGIRVRQPLNAIVVVAPDQRRRDLLKGMEPLITDELNVKQIRYAETEQELLSKSARPNFKTLGPKFGKNVNKVAAFIEEMGEEEVNAVINKGREQVSLEGHEIYIEPEDIQVEIESREGLAAHSDQNLTVALEIELTPELLHEGLAREFVNRVQKMRKEAGFDVMDRIKIYADPSEDMKQAIEKMNNYILQETLCNDIIFNQMKGDLKKTWSIDEHTVTIGVEQV
ncbi:MAG: isoleucine--tRNA ligase [candidate division KSB1 bacterium]|nr:isoleucine--tRNA ligase [candidate division KSB1 bacterium]